MPKFHLVVTLSVAALLAGCSAGTGPVPSPTSPSPHATLGTISGRLTGGGGPVGASDAGPIPLAGVLVSIREPTGHVGTVLTDREGYFTVTVKPGTYVLSKCDSQRAQVTSGTTASVALYCAFA